MQTIIRNSKELGEAMRLARTRSAMRQTDVAKKAGIRQALVSDLENGVAAAKLDTLIKVLAVLDMDLSVMPRRKDEFDPTEY